MADYAFARNLTSSNIRSSSLFIYMETLKSGFDWLLEASDQLNDAVVQSNHATNNFRQDSLGMLRKQDSLADGI